MKHLIFDIGIFSYELKPAELIWAALQGATAFAVTVTVAPVNAADWQAYAIGIAAGAARAVVAVVLGRKPAP